MPGLRHWGVESERDMYYATKRSNTKTRAIGVVGVALGLGVSGYALANGLGIIETNERVETEVVMIEELEEIVEDEPPPPPVDVDLPPPPPQVILPDFVFDTPPPQENAIREVVAVAKPQPPAAAKPAPPPRPTLSKRPSVGRRFKEPEYPAASRRAGEEGETRVSVCVDTDGRMSNVKVVKSSGFDRLDEQAIKALTNNRLDPAIGSDGKPIAMCDPYPYEFTYVWTLKKG